MAFPRDRAPNGFAFFPVPWSAGGDSLEGNRGYRVLGDLLRREGHQVNHNRVFRLYQADGLGLKRKKRKKVARSRREPIAPPSRANERWSMDFMSRALGRKLPIDFGAAQGATRVVGIALIVPHRSSKALVTDGPYRITRNPMYLGLALLYIGATLFANSAWPLMALACLFG